MKWLSIVNRHPVNVILVLAILVVFTTQMSMGGLTKNSLFNTFFAIVCAGVINRYVARFGKMGFAEWLRSHAALSAFITLACGSTASLLIYVYLVEYFEPVIALSGFVTASLLILAWLFVTEMVGAALKAAWNKIRGLCGPGRRRP